MTAATAEVPTRRWRVGEGFDTPAGFDVRWFPHSVSASTRPEAIAAARKLIGFTTPHIVAVESANTPRR